MDLDECPTLCIPCDPIKNLIKLVDILYELKILTDESIYFKNCPQNIVDMLNKPDFFEPVEIGGIKAVKGQTEINTDKLL